MQEHFHECARPAGLQAWVHAAHQRRALGAGAFSRLPMPWMSLTVQLGAGGEWQDPHGRWRPFPPLALRGLFDAPSPAREDPRAPVDYALALLHPWACEPLFGVPAALLRNEVLDLRLVLPRWSTRLLADAVEGEPLASLLAALRERASEKVPGAMARAAGLLQRVGGGSLKPLAGLHAERSLRAQFHAQLGLPPKRYARLLRFALALRAQHARPWHLDFCDAQLAADYADDAHRHREFHEFAGCTPRQYREVKASGPRTVFTVPRLWHQPA